MWHKYPNPKCTHVVSIDVVDRTIDPTTGIIRTERILGCKQKAPTWIDSSLIFAETVSSLLFPFMITFLLVFLVIFEYVLGAFSEITRFADRKFYSDWWNSYVYP